MSQKELQRVSVISGCVKGDGVRQSRLTALGMQDDATGKILDAQFFPPSAVSEAKATPACNSRWLRQGDIFMLLPG